MKNKKGFTLIELLAVIVVLAIIMVIATGSVVKTIENARTSAFLSSYEMVLKTVKNNVGMANIGLLDVNDIMCSSNPSDTNNCYNKYGIDNNEYEMMITRNSTSGFEMSLKGKGKFENINISEGDISQNVISYSATNDTSKNNSVLVNVDTSGRIIEYTPEKKAEITEEKQLFIEYNNLLIKNAETFIKEGEAATRALYNTDYKDGAAAFTNQFCSTGTLISIKRKDNDGKYGTDKIDVKNIGSLKDERICYYKTNNNTIMTCVKEDGTLYKPDETTNCY